MRDTLTQRDVEFTYADTAQPRAIPDVDREVNAAQGELLRAWQHFYATVDGREFLDCDAYWEERAAKLAWIDVCTAARDLAQMQRERYYLDCSCTPISNACPACIAANRVRYGDEIPT